MKIKRIHARQVFDSIGFPTVEVDVTLDNGATGRATIPSGASTGKFEALDLRNGDPNKYDGCGVSKAISNVNKIIAPRVIGMRVSDQRQIDETLIRLDGTKNKSKLGANAILGVSLAVAKAASLTNGNPLYRYIMNSKDVKMPIPIVQVIHGGLQSGGVLDFREFAIQPLNASNIAQALDIGSDVYKTTLKILQDRKGYGQLVAFDGALAPMLRSNEDALSILTEAVEKAGYKPGTDVGLYIDVAASHFYIHERYRTIERSMDAKKMSEHLEDLCSKYPIVSIEDGMARNDWEGWAILSQSLGDSIQLVGDEIFVTNKERLRKGIEQNVANSIIVKMNQVGTITETLEVADLAKRSGFNIVTSARYGETEDVAVCHLAIAIGSKQVKFGGFRNTERLSKFNELLRIEEKMTEKRIYRVRDILPIQK